MNRWMVALGLGFALCVGLLVHFTGDTWSEVQRVVVSGGSWGRSDSHGTDAPTHPSAQPHGADSALGAAARKSLPFQSSCDSAEGRASAKALYAQHRALNAPLAKPERADSGEKEDSSAKDDSSDSEDARAQAVFNAFIDRMGQHADPSVQTAAQVIGLLTTALGWQRGLGGPAGTEAAPYPSTLATTGLSARDEALRRLARVAQSAPSPTGAALFARVCDGMAQRDQGGAPACEGAASRWAQRDPQNGWAWYVAAAESLRRGDTQGADAALHRASLLQWDPEALPDASRLLIRNVPSSTPAHDYLAISWFSLSRQIAWPELYGGEVRRHCARADVNQRQVCQRVAHRLVEGAPDLMQRAMGVALLLKSGVSAAEVEPIRAESRQLTAEAMTASELPPAVREEEECRGLDRFAEVLSERAEKGELAAIRSRLRMREGRAR